MELLYLGIIFLIIVALLALRRPLYQAILGGLAVTALLWKMPAVRRFSSGFYPLRRR